MAGTASESFAWLTSSLHCDRVCRHRSPCSNAILFCAAAQSELISRRPLAREALKRSISEKISAHVMSCTVSALAWWAALAVASADSIGCF